MNAPGLPRIGLISADRPRAEIGRTCSHVTETDTVVSQVYSRARYKRAADGNTWEFQRKDTLAVGQWWPLTEDQVARMWPGEVAPPSDQLSAVHLRLKQLLDEREARPERTVQVQSLPAALAARIVYGTHHVETEPVGSRMWWTLHRVDPVTASQSYDDEPGPPVRRRARQGDRVELTTARLRDHAERVGLVKVGDLPEGVRFTDWAAVLDELRALATPARPRPGDWLRRALNPGA